MNGYLINLRGINASGKSTAVREFCKEQNMIPQELSYKGEKFRYMTNGKKVALGWYKPYSAAEGLDTMKQNKEEFKDFLGFFLDFVKPEIVVYEKQIWSTTYKLTYEISNIAKKHGYQYIAVVMCISYETALNRMFNRNGGNFKNFENFDSRFYSVYNTRKNMLRNRFVLFDAETEKTKEERMGEIIECAVEKFEKGERRGRVEVKQGEM